MARKTVTLSSAQSMIRSTVARALAKSLVLGFNQADEEGCPLTQAQQVHMATMSVMAYDLAVEAAEALVAVSEIERVMR